MAKQALPDWDELFMSAALQPERWLDSLDLMARHTGSSHGQLIGLGNDRAVPFNLVSDLSTECIAGFVEIDGGSPEANFRVATSQRHIESGHYDALLHEQHYEAEVGRLRSRRYLQFCDDWDIPFGCQTNLVVDGYGLIGFATLRKRRDGRTTPAQRRVFARAAQAARRAVRLQERLEGEQARFLSGAFEAIGICAFILDQRGALIAHTARADALVSRGDVRLTGKALDAPGMPIGLRQAIRSVVSSDGLANLRLRIDAPPGRAPLLIEAFRLPTSGWSLGKTPAAVLIANSPRQDRAGITGFLTTLYRLTEAEADIALRLVQGTSRHAIAAAREVTTETLRGQIKSIHAKCGVENEAGLIRLLGALVA